MRQKINQLLSWLAMLWITGVFATASTFVLPLTLIVGNLVGLNKAQHELST